MLKPVIGLLITLLCYFQFHLWWGEGSIQYLKTLEQDIRIQAEAVERLKKRNETLHQEVLSLKHNYEAIEERARTDLGMIEKTEQFVMTSQ